MNNEKNTNATLDRMKALMGYGLQTESKAPYSSIENQKLGADGNNYAIIREGKNYYIKVAPNKQNLVKEDFQYIGGFRNRKDYQYDSFAKAQKNFDLKMMSLNEAANKHDIDTSSWNLEKKEGVVVEATESMRKEILRERQIMRNAVAINEKKEIDNKDICCDIKDSQKDNIKKEEPKTGSAKDAVDGYEDAKLPKDMTEGVVKEEEVLGWNRGNDDYMDKSHGTEIGDSAPFDDKEARNIDDGDKKVSQTGEMKNGVVENHGTSMHDADNQNSPSVGVGEGPSDDNNKPFDDEKGKQIDEAIDGLDDGEESLDGGEGLEGEDDFGDEDLEGEDDFEGEDFGDEEPIEGDEEPLDGEGEDVYEDDTESRLDAMEELLRQIAGKLGIDEAPVDAAEYGDDDIFGDEEGDEDFGDEEPIGDDFGGEEDFEDDEMPMENKRRGGVQVFETKAYRNAMRKQKVNEEGMKPFKDAGRVPSGNMNKLDDFGKHPAYQKKVMELPPKDLQEFPGYYDMNDDSVRNDTPYGEKIGSGAPFEIDPQAIDNAIAEAFNRLKKNR